MRLWHQTLVPYLPRQQLLGQHRECCALRGKGWGRKHGTVDYVFRYNPSYLFVYHLLVMDAMSERGYEVDPSWYDRMYRGKKLRKYHTLQEAGTFTAFATRDGIIYEEHDDRYLLECLLNLKAKGAELVNGKTIEEFLLELESKGVHF